MYLQALLVILFVASVSMMSTISTTFKDETISTTFKDETISTTFKDETISTTFKDETISTAFKDKTISTTFKDEPNDFTALTTTMSTETMLCDTDLKFECKTPDESTISVLYPGLFKSAYQETNFRKRRQSLGSCAKPNGSYAIVQLSNDKDMCCIKYRQLKALCFIKDVFGVTYEVVHLLELGQYQFLPYTFCGKSTCSGQCLQQNTPTSVLVWNSSEGFPWVKFATVNLPTHCSCLNGGG